MTHFALTATLLWICLLKINSSYYILSNDANIRILSLSSDCGEGRVEFYNGSIWGTLTDCSKSFNTEHAKLICNSLGFELEEEYWRGMSHYNKNISAAANPLIVYTKIDNCSLAKQNNICSQCLFTNDLDSCTMNDNINIHEQYDIFISCNNYGFNTQSSKYDCISYEEYDTNNLEYKSCTFSHEINSDKKNKKILISIVGIAIFGSIFCVIIFAIYSKCQDTKRLSLETDHGEISGFATVPQEVQLGAMRDKENYVPPPQPLFIYQTRQIDTQDINENINIIDLSDEDIDDEDGGYNMEEILPNVIYNKNKSTSESYGLIKNHDYDEDEEEEDENEDEDVSHQYEESK